MILNKLSCHIETARRTVSFETHFCICRPRLRQQRSSAVKEVERSVLSTTGDGRTGLTTL